MIGGRRDAIVVTGATSFVGSHVVRRLLREEYEVLVILRSSAAPHRLADVTDRVAIARGEIGEPGVELAVSRFAPGALVHLAWSGVRGPGREDAAVQLRNIELALASVELAARAGCERWVGIGSQDEYAPFSEYGLAKRRAAVATADLCAVRGMRFTWLRLFAAYGAYDHPQRLIPYVTLKLLRRRLPRLTAGEQSWDFLHVEDVADAIAEVLGARTVGDLDLGSGKSVSIRAIAERIRDLIDPQLPLGFGSLPYRAGEPACWRADPVPLIAACGWRPRTPLEDGLAGTVAWFRERAAQFD